MFIGRHFIVTERRIETDGPIRVYFTVVLTFITSHVMAHRMFETNPLSVTRTFIPANETSIRRIAICEVYSWQALEDKTPKTLWEPLCNDRISRKVNCQNNLQRWRSVAEWVFHKRSCWEVTHKTHCIFTPRCGCSFQFYFSFVHFSFD